MYPDYKSHILLKYKSWQNAQRLSPLLNQPTPGSLRTECANLCQERFDKRDEQILRAFFGPYENQKAYTSAIAEFEVDKFRPLWKFITGKIINTRVENIELLAWLMDVQPRPFQSNYPYETLDLEPEPLENENKNQDSREISPIVNNIIEGSDAIDSKNASGDDATSPVPSGKRRIFIAAVLLFFISLSVYLIPAVADRGGCMYWTGAHYEAVACNKKIEGALVIAADSDKLQHFKKITCPDTITIKALGYVWYSKINNKIEYFTADGYHPVQTQYHLKPLTRYMIEMNIH